MLYLLRLLMDLRVPASQLTLLMLPLYKQSRGTIDYQLNLTIEKAA